MTETRWGSRAFFGGRAKQVHSIILGIDPVPRIALDAKNKQFAVADREGITVVQL
jgi:hypothetical protein